MKRPIGGLCAVFLALAVISVISIPVAAVADTCNVQPLFPKLQSFDIDEFTYRASFRLPDGTEGLLMRSSFAVTYLYQHNCPPVSQLYMSVQMAFYYGRTMMSRPVLQNVSVGSIAFYPKWHDAAGHLHDTYMVHPLFVLNDTIGDGQAIGRTLLMDSRAFSRYVIDFGGTLVIDRLVFVLGDGLEVPLTQGRAEIVLEKYYNDFDSRAASLNSIDNLTSLADTSMIAVVANGNTFIPFIVILDGAIALSLFGTAALLILLTTLHLTGRMKIPLGRVRTLMHRPTSRRQQTQNR